MFGARRHHGDRVFPGFASLRSWRTAIAPSHPHRAKSGGSIPRAVKDRARRPSRPPPPSSALAEPRLCRPGGPPLRSSLTALPPCSFGLSPPLPPKNASRVPRKGAFQPDADHLHFAYIALPYTSLPLSYSSPRLEATCTFRQRHYYRAGHRGASNFALGCITASQFY